ncbi:hypothetical protein L1049_027906 [Liquidambar formosana]|uniref:Uncharacterized protein n=1 Tax=Liquidambar formosana TaxID=63359 RepID=A0AAP0RLP9_LIQFO
MSNHNTILILRTIAFFTGNLPFRSHLNIRTHAPSTLTFQPSKTASILDVLQWSHLTLGAYPPQQARKNARTVNTEITAKNCQWILSCAKHYSMQLPDYSQLIPVAVADRAMVMLLPSTC